MEGWDSSAAARPAEATLIASAAPTTRKRDCPGMQFLLI
jgi:hypothetical protein